MSSLLKILEYNASTPKHIPLGLLILGGIIVLWLIMKGRDGATLGDAISTLGLLAMGVGVVILALRWKPNVTNTTNNTYPTVTKTIVQGGGSSSGLWTEILIAVGVAIAIGGILSILKRMH